MIYLPCTGNATELADGENTGCVAATVAVVAMPSAVLKTAMPL